MAKTTKITIITLLIGVGLSLAGASAWLNTPSQSTSNELQPPPELDRSSQPFATPEGNSTATKSIFSMNDHEPPPRIAPGLAALKKTPDKKVAIRRLITKTTHEVIFHPALDYEFITLELEASRLPSSTHFWRGRDYAMVIATEWLSDYGKRLFLLATTRSSGQKLSYQYFYRDPDIAANIASFIHYPPTPNTLIHFLHSSIFSSSIEGLKTLPADQRQEILEAIKALQTALATIDLPELSAKEIIQKKQKHIALSLQPTSNKAELQEFLSLAYAIVANDDQTSLFQFLPSYPMQPAAQRTLTRYVEKSLSEMDEAARIALLGSALQRPIQQRIIFKVFSSIDWATCQLNWQIAHEFLRNSYQPLTHYSEIETKALPEVSSRISRVINVMLAPRNLDRAMATGLANFFNANEVVRNRYPSQLWFWDSYYQAALHLTDIPEKSDLGHSMLATFAQQAPPQKRQLAEHLDRLLDSGHEDQCLRVLKEAEYGLSFNSTIALSNKAKTSDVIDALWHHWHDNRRYAPRLGNLNLADCKRWVELGAIAPSSYISQFYQRDVVSISPKRKGSKESDLRSHYAVYFFSLFVAGNYPTWQKAFEHNFIPKPFHLDRSPPTEEMQWQVNDLFTEAHQQQALNTAYRAYFELLEKGKITALGSAGHWLEFAIENNLNTVDREILLQHFPVYSSVQTR